MRRFLTERIDVVNKRLPTKKDTPAATAALIRAIHTEDFSAALADYLNSVVPFDYLVMFRYDREEEPKVLYDNFDTQFSLDSLQTYLAGPYLLDPFFEVCRKPEPTGTIHLKDIAPDHFYRSEYYRTYYITTEILDEVCIFVPMSDGITIVATIERMRGNRPFRKREVEQYRGVEAIVREAIVQNWRDAEYLNAKQHSASEPKDALPERVKNIVGISGRSNLTNRESEVVSLILRGYSSIAIASILDISSATVKVHRKNIYSKLKISSQAELFSLFMPLLSQTAA